MLMPGLAIETPLRQQLEADAKRVPGLRILDGRFMVINQAIGIPLGREEGKRYVAAFVEEMKAGGFVLRSLQRHNIRSAAVAPAAGT